MRLSQTHYLYRGVHARHPALQDALAGIVRPAQPDSLLSPKEHNLGGFSDRSPFTSWTHDREVALWHARRYGEGGVLMRVAAGKPIPGETWEWVQSDDLWSEDEVLLRGVRLNVEVYQV